MAKTTKADVRALEQLAKTRDQIGQLSDELERIRARRDFLIVAAYRRGISLRVIGQAAGVHHTRVRQLGKEADDVAKANNLKPMATRKRTPQVEACLMCAMQAQLPSIQGETEP